MKEKEMTEATHHQCKQCEFYTKIKYTLDVLDDRVKSIKPPPGEVPRLKDIEISGMSLAKEGVTGGDHIIYIDFNKRYDLNARKKKIEEKWQKEMKDFSPQEQLDNPYIQKKKKEKDEKMAGLKKNRTRAGVLVADVKGHDESGSFIVGMLHQSFLTGALYEMKTYGKITTNLFEKINTRFYNSSSVDDFFTMIYGEISENGKFLFISAGHPPPLVFSNEGDHFLDVPEDKIFNYPPIGVMPSRKDIDATLNKSVFGYKQAYKISKLDLMGSGDILLLYTDGLSELENSEGERLFPHHLEKVLKENKALSAKEICSAVKKAIDDFCKEPDDDITYVIIKKN
ncbi:MAG: serine/threonine-protein phosphatase [Candidatus Aminicenantes bacterium]|nr:serine/threonine-protein phosphatase [Candidatus Aminicenantes bacterium]